MPAFYYPSGLTNIAALDNDLLVSRLYTERIGTFALLPNLVASAGFISAANYANGNNTTPVFCPSDSLTNTWSRFGHHPSSTGKATTNTPCDDHDEPTPALTEGPYFTPNSPKRNTLLERSVSGTTLVLRGQVVNTNCKPVANALLDWWQADDRGEYDNEGFRLRGHQYTDRQGYFQLETVVPGLYPGRTRHLHVKVQAPGRRTLTTQLFFPDEPGNGRDRIFDPVLVMDIQRKDDREIGAYTFVLKA